MNKYAKLILAYAIAAVIIVVLYSPGLLALNPTDSGVLKPGLAIICGILIVAALIYVTYSTLRPEKYERLEAGKSDSAERIAGILNRYRQDPILGQIAQSTAEEMETARRKRKGLEDIVAAKFSRKSLTYGKFMNAIEMALHTVEKNAALVANRMQAFDTKEYQQVSRLIESGAYRVDNIPDSIQEEKAMLLKGELDEMNAVVAANESLLLELDKFSVELARLDAETAESENEDMIQELQQLVRETQYYK